MKRADELEHESRDEKASLPLEMWHFLKASLKVTIQFLHLLCMSKMHAQSVKESLIKDVTTAGLKRFSWKVEKLSDRVQGLEKLSILEVKYRSTKIFAGAQDSYIQQVKKNV